LLCHGLVYCLDTEYRTLKRIWPHLSDYVHDSLNVSCEKV
jgi:hypothetical protein